MGKGPVLQSLEALLDWSSSPGLPFGCMSFWITLNIFTSYRFYRRSMPILEGWVTLFWWRRLQVKEILKNTPTLVDVEIPDGQTITVCGDVHGQYYDLLNIWNINGLPSEDNPYLFNGGPLLTHPTRVGVILLCGGVQARCLVDVATVLSRGPLCSHTITCSHVALLCSMWKGAACLTWPHCESRAPKCLNV